MANTKKYVSLDKLSLYDEKIKGVISAGDAAALQSAKDYADGLAGNYDAAGSAATAEANAKAYADGKDAAIQAAQKAADDAAAAAGVADGKAVAAQGEVDALETYVGTIPATATATDVIGYIQEKTSGIATDTALTELTGRVAQAETDIDNIEKDYLKAADKTELEGKITAANTAITEEVNRAKGIEAGIDARLKAVTDDYLKAADKTELQGNIDTVAGAVERLTNGVSADEIDGVNDLIQYVKDHGTEVTGMQEDISDNADAIAGVAGRMDTAEGKITAVEGAVATKAEQSALEEAVEALEGADTTLGNRITALEGKFTGEGSVEDMIADAKQEAIDAAAGDATTKADKALSDAKLYADGINAGLDSRLDKLEAIDHEHANKELLDTYTQTEANLADAVAKKHEHTNKTVLDGITAEKVTAWDAAEQNAKTYADGIHAGLNARVKTLEDWHTNFTEVSEEEINALFA